MAEHPMERKPRGPRETLLALPGIRNLVGWAKAFPALSLSLAIGAGLSLVCEIVERVLYWDPRPKMFLLGDSGFCNYRLSTGEKLEDQLSRLLPGHSVVNFAKPGARPVDLVLQYVRGKAVAGSPDRVVVLLSPELLLAAPNRMDGDGEELRHLTLDADGLAIFRHLDSRERNIAAVQRISQFVLAPTDAAHELWLRWWKWPRKRAKILHSGPERHAMIAADCIRRGEILQETPMPSREGFDTLQTMGDVGLLLDLIRKGGASPEVLVLPFGNPDLIAANWSESAKGKRDSSITLLRDWMERHHVSFLDFNEAKWSSTFPGSEWDDMDHLRTPASYGRIAKGIAERQGIR